MTKSLVMDEAANTTIMRVQAKWVDLAVLQYRSLSQHRPRRSTENKISKLKASLIGQQNTFKKQISHSDSTVYASYLLSKMAAREGRHFTSSEPVSAVC